MKLGDIIKKMELKFPLFLQEKWDNSGLIIGDREAEIKKVQISLDVTDSVIENAVKNEVDLIISHHPVIFQELKQINDSTVLGKKIIKLIKNGINVYSMHTNFDSAKDGLNQYITEKIEGKNIKIISENYYKVYKMGIYIPKENLEEILKVINSSEELEFLGYKRVSYMSETLERVLVGNEMKENENYKIEFIGEKDKLYTIFNKIKTKHLYKEPAFEIVELENKYKTGTGIGRIFSLENPMNIEDYSEYLKEKLGLDFLKYVKSNEKIIKKAAIVNGSGKDFWKKAYDLGADVFLTGDIDYHTALDAYEKGFNLIDIGHYESEHFFNEIIIKNLSDNLSVEVYNEKRILKTL